MTVGYTRLSLDKYGDHLGVTRQREDIATLAGVLGWPPVTEFYEDNDTSANVDRRKPRPQFDRLLRDMRVGSVTHVLCYDQDRLVRDMRQLEDVADAVETGGVLLTSVNGDIDLRSDNGRMVARIKAAVARHEIEKMSRRLRRQKRQRAQSGKKNTSGYRTFGYEYDFAIVPSEAAALRKMFKRIATGHSPIAVARWLNKTKVPSVTGLVGRWGADDVRRMIRRREYMGVVTLRGEIVGTASFKAAIDAETFERANAALPAVPDSWRKVEETGLLTGLLICAVCQGRMRRGRGAHGQRNYECTQCRRRRVLGLDDGQGKPARGLSVSVGIETAVLSAIASKVEELKESDKWSSEQVRAVENEIEQARRRHASGALTSAELGSVLKHLTSRLVEERQAPRRLQLLDRESWSKWTLQARREWLAMVVDRIEVTKAERQGAVMELTRVTIVFKNGDRQRLGSPRVTIQDVARLVGLSKNHVGHVLTESGSYSLATRDRVLAACEELGYVPGWQRNKED